MSNYLLGIGIDNYTSCTKLSNPVRDIKAITSILHSKYQFESHNTKLLLDGDATLKNMINEFEFFCSKLTESDNLVLPVVGVLSPTTNLPVGERTPTMGISFAW